MILITAVVSHNITQPVSVLSFRKPVLRNNPSEAAEVYHTYIILFCQLCYIKLHAITRDKARF